MRENYPRLNSACILKSLVFSLGVLLACNLTKVVLPDTSHATQTTQSIQPNAEQEEKVVETATNLPSVPKLEERHYYEEGEHLPYTINLTYCQAQQQGSAFQHFNDIVDQFLNQQIMEFKQAVQETTKNEQTSVVDGVSMSLTITCETAYLSPDLISVLFNIDTFLGGAHPMLTAYTINYDITQQTILTLADLFEPQAPYLNLLADYCSKDLSARNALDFSEGAEPTEENYRHWLLKPQGLEIIFDPYQVAPYALGRQTVLIPYTALQVGLKKGGVIDKIRQ